MTMAERNGDKEMVDISVYFIVLGIKNENE